MINYLCQRTLSHLSGSVARLSAYPGGVEIPADFLDDFLDAKGIEADPELEIAIRLSAN
jgi:hypothetical protein